MALLAAALASWETTRAALAVGEVLDLQAPPETRFRLTRALSFGAKAEAEVVYQRNLDLDRHRDDDAAVLTPQLSLAWSYDPTPAFQAFLNLVVAGDVVLADGAVRPDANEAWEVEIKEAYVWVRPRPDGPSLQLGRQRFEDEREWLFDAELDAVRARYAAGALAVELAFGRQGLARKDLRSDRDRERVDTLVGRAAYRLLDRIELEGYVLVRDYPTGERRRPVFAGLRSRGEPLEDLDYWLELAYAGGRDGANLIRGWALDVGATYEWQVPWKPTLTAGVALGSGDRHPDDGIDGNFRQTGLQENEGDFGGAASFKYYGEVLDPELSNLVVLTVGVGVRPAETVSLDVVYHHYLQHRAAPRLGDVRLDAEPSGRSRRLGSALDLVLGVEGLFQRIDALLAVGYFAPGAAFLSTAGDAWLVRAELQVRF